MDADAVSRLRRVVAKLSREFNASATEAGLTPTQASVLGLIAAQGPLSLASLIALERINPSMLSRVISKLDGDGLIRRIPDPDDQRAVLAEATPAGMEVRERIRAHRTAAVANHVAELPRGQAEAITAALPALEALVARLEADPRT